MEYKLKVTDELKWIDNICEMKNTDEVLVLYVDFHAKRLFFIEGGSYEENNKEYRGVAFMKDEETLYAEGEQIGEVMVLTDKNVSMFMRYSKYELTLVFVKNAFEDVDDHKFVYSE